MQNRIGCCATRLGAISMRCRFHTELASGVIQMSRPTIKCSIVEDNLYIIRSKRRRERFAKLHELAESNATKNDLQAEEAAKLVDEVRQEIYDHNSQ